MDIDSGFYGANAPLVFVRPVGFTADDSLRLMKAAQRMSESVRWRLAPTGVQADVYLAHRANIVHTSATGTGGDKPGNSKPEESMGEAYAHAQLHLDPKGRYKNHPVCLLGAAAPADADNTAHRLPALQFPAALEELRLGLQRVERDLYLLRALYVLGRSAWQERARWRSHRLHVIHAARLVAAVEPAQWRVHILQIAPIEQIEQGHTMLVPQSSVFVAPGFETLPLEKALWEFAKRCPEALLEQILPTVYLSEPLTHRRHTELSRRVLGEHCVAILGALDTQSRTAEDLLVNLRLSRPALLRALACLALTRAIRPERQTPGWRRWLNWLPQRLRQRVFGPSALH